MINQLYTYDYYPHNSQYHLLIIVKWSDRTEKAKSLGQKAFYIHNKADDVHKLLTKENVLRCIYNMPQYSKIHSFFDINMNPNVKEELYEEAIMELKKKYISYRQELQNVMNKYGKSENEILEKIGGKYGE